MFKVNNKDTRMTPMVFIVNSEHLLYLLYIYIYIYINHQVPKIVRTSGNKTNPKKINQIVQVTAAINTEYTDS